ncbi:MAG TPA: alpha/beta hydrolase [Steroidobacteraceae bacterium]
MSDTLPLDQKLRTIGVDITPEMITATAALVAPLHAGTSREGVQITRDLRYGPHERHRLDVFEPQGRGGEPWPVLLFVHGGGFTTGDKTAPGSPFYDNVGLWAVRSGVIGVTMTYRLAPQFTWPSGSDDVALAVKWVRENIAARGGDVNRVFVMGQSAGAVHVAGYVAREFGDYQGNSPRESWRPGGAILVSGLYDTDTMEREARFRAYFGTDDAKLENVSFLGALAGSKTPLLAVVAELDPKDFLRQFVVLLEACVRRQVRLPRLVQLTGHNHLTTVWQLNTAGDTLGPELLDFIAIPRKPGASISVVRQL